MPRELPLPPPGNNNSNDRRSPIPFMNQTPSSTSNTGDVRIPDIGGGGRAPAPSERVLMNPMLVDRSPVYRKSVVRSPIPTKQSPRVHHPPHYYSPRQPSASHANEHPTYNVNFDSEPLRRTSVLYDTSANRTPPPPPPPINNRASPYHHRHSSSSSGSVRQPTEKSSPVESSAADTLMSMAQKGFVSQKKRVLEMADSEEEDVEDKKPRLEKTTEALHEDTTTKGASIPVSS